jgi:hypothetical protein
LGHLTKSISIFQQRDRIRQANLFGVAAIPYDWELWRYGYIEGIGEDVEFRFVDTCACGRYEVPIEKRDLNRYKTN